MNPEAATPAGAATDTLHLFAIHFSGRIGPITLPFPARRGTDGVHDALLQHFRQAAAKDTGQGECEAVNADVVIFVKGAGFMNRARLVLAGTERGGTQEIGILAPHGTFPFALLLEVVFPCDAGVVG